jgi:signal transduction histidine kinase/ActR/RegA family two-component response regulator
MSDLDYAAIFQAVPGPHLVLLPDAPTYTVAAVNEAYTAATMSRSVDLIDRGLFETFPNDDAETRTVIANLRASLDCVIRYRKPHQMDLMKCAIRRAQEHGGGFEDKFWETSNTPVLDDSGDIRLIIHSIVDVTEKFRIDTARKKLETAAHEAQESAEAANLAKSEFLANISHEIRTPLNAIVGLSTILAKGEGLAPRQRDYVQTLQVSANSLLGLINDLLDISKIESRSIELEHIPFDLVRLLNEIVSMMSVPAREKNLDISIERPPVSGRVLMGDPMRLQQIILNLCTNAIKFTEVGGVYLGVTSNPSDIDGFEMLSISVRDTGVGIPAEKQHLIFDKFVQADSSISRKFGGTGLGLAITKALTEAMGGTITLQSVPGQGAIFTITLPLMIGDSVAAIESPAYVGAVEDSTERAFRTIVTGNVSPATDRRVLLVEDHEGNVLVASTFIEEFGCSHDLASNGFEAIEKACARSYVAILMDIKIPGLNGFEVTRAIRSYEKGNNKPRVPIIAMTAHALTNFRDRCLASDMDDYLSKPFNARELASKLKKYLDFTYSTPGDSPGGTVMLSGWRQR